MEQQSGPLQSMSDGRTVRLKLIIRPITVVIELRMPMRIEVLRNPPSLGLSEFQRHPTCDAQSSLSQSMITRRVGSGQQGFHSVHIGVDAAIVLEVREVSVPGIDEHARHIVEEPLLPHLERLAQ